MIATALPAVTLVGWALLILAGLSATASVVPFLFAEAVSVVAYVVVIQKRLRERPLYRRRRR